MLSWVGLVIFYDLGTKSENAASEQSLYYLQKTNEYFFLQYIKEK